MLLARRWPAVESTVRRAPTSQHYSNRGMPCAGEALAAAAATAAPAAPRTGVWPSDSVASCHPNQTPFHGSGAAGTTLPGRLARHMCP